MPRRLHGAREQAVHTRRVLVRQDHILVSVARDDDTLYQDRSDQERPMMDDDDEQHLCHLSIPPTHIFLSNKQFEFLYILHETNLLTFIERHFYAFK